jgi:uncharacterized 2Fe-2S/4Fe-4S cluster protein (DUF4445 family)
LPNFVLLLDIGTTTISGEIFNPRAKKSLAIGLTPNEQAEFGDDIISRIGFALQDKTNARLLQAAISCSVNKLVKRLTADAKINKTDIKSVLCASNSAIHHMFLGFDLSTLVTPPYRPVHKQGLVIAAGKLGLNIAHNAHVRFLPNIGGFIGSDALCVLLASRICDSESPRLAIDIGTNGEIILGNKHRIIAASTAAGPAFEAGYIRNGMPAIKGAIDQIRIKNGKIHYHVIGGVKPKGITGSGLIDGCYEMLRTNAIDKFGKMKGKEFIVYEKGLKKVVVTQTDIRKLQLAKAAISAGVKVLLRRYKADFSDLEEIFFTGSFGGSVNASSAMGIGLIPETDKSKIKYLKNSVLAGLRLCAASPAAEEKLTDTIKIIEHMPLFGKYFEKQFMGSLSFGQYL